MCRVTFCWWKMNNSFEDRTLLPEFQGRRHHCSIQFETTRKVNMHDYDGIFHSIKAGGNLCSCAMGMTHPRTGVYKCRMSKQGHSNSEHPPPQSLLSSQHVLQQLLWKLLPVLGGPPATPDLFLWFLLPQQCLLQHWPPNSHHPPVGFLSPQWVSGNLLWAHHLPHILCGLQTLPEALLPPEDPSVLQTLPVTFLRISRLRFQGLPVFWLWLPNPGLWILWFPVSGMWYSQFFNPKLWVQLLPPNPLLF